MRKSEEFIVEEPDAVIELSVYGNTLSHVFIFGLDEHVQAGACVIANPEYRGLAISLLEGAIELLRTADWQEILPFDDNENVWSVTGSKTPSDDGELRQGKTVIDDDMPF